MVSFYQESKHLPKYLQLISVFISLPWWVSFRKRLAGALSTRTQEYDLIWRLQLERGSQGKKRSFGWVLTPYDWCPCKTGKFGQRGTGGRQCEGTVEEGGHLQAKERELEESLPAQPSQGASPATLQYYVTVNAHCSSYQSVAPCHDSPRKWTQSSRP